MGPQEFYQNAAIFLSTLDADLSAAGVGIPKHWDVDHLCYRVETLERYQQMKSLFATFGNLLAETEVNGRPICTFKLAKPVIHRHYQIDLVELPAPKPGKTTPEGFEHIEIICDLPWDEMKRKYAALKLNEGGLKKDFNAELELELGPRNIKFHYLSLESVVNLENNARVFRALKDSQILSLFKQNDPLVAGTFPLKVNTASSDLDILMKAADLKELESRLREHYGAYFFTSRETQVDGLPTQITQFTWDGVPFEVFAQDRDPVAQRAYRHFQTEERHLKKGGESLRTHIVELRSQGLKTEPAFAKALGLAGDPYEALLEFKEF